METVNRKDLLLLLPCVALLLMVQRTHAREEVIPPHINVERLHITSNVTHRFATTHVLSVLNNLADETKEITFWMTVPKSGFITGFTMESDTEVYEGEVMDEIRARQMYDRAKAKGTVAAKVIPEDPDEDARLFRISLTVAGSSRATFQLTYQDLLERRFSKYENAIDVDPGQAVRDFQIKVFIEECKAIRNLRVPPMSSSSYDGDDRAEDPIARVTYFCPQMAMVSYAPTLEQQTEVAESGLSGQFRVQYDLERTGGAGEIQIKDGYFVHYYAPTGIKPLPKNVLFVLDTSGSMFGTKIQQTKDAMLTILGDLNDDDNFNIVTFATEVKYWKESGLIKANKKNLKEAKSFIRAMRGSGGTNINDALIRALGFLHNLEEVQQDGLAMIIFMTDGEPTDGESEKPKILSNVRNINTDDVVIFSLGFGKGVDFPFIQKIALQNSGAARRIYEKADVVAQFAGFFQEVSSPLISEIEVNYMGETVDPGSVTTTDFHSYFDGSEIVVAGKMADGGRNVIAQVSGEGADGEIFHESNEDGSGCPAPECGGVGWSSGGNSAERMWAYMTIRNYLDLMRTSADETIRAEARQRVREMSLRYKFLTPITTLMLKRTIKGGGGGGGAGGGGGGAGGGGAGGGGGGAGGGGGGGGRGTGGGAAAYGPSVIYLGYEGEGTMPTDPPPEGYRPGVTGDPHFMVWLSGLKDAVCFDINGQAGDVFQLIHDSHTGIVVNGKVITKSTADVPKSPTKTYFGELAIMVGQSLIKIHPTKINMNGKLFEWHHNISTGGTALRMRVHTRKVLIDIGYDVSFKIMRHLVNKNKPDMHYLGFYIRDSRGLSNSVHGLLGQFLHRTAHKLHSDNGTVDDSGKPVANLSLTGSVTGEHRVVLARLSQKRNMETGAPTQCWFVRNRGQGLIDGGHKDYNVASLTHKGFALKNVGVSKFLL